MPINLYIHFPFCNQKCHYCSFFSKTSCLNLADDYCRAVIKEIKSRKKLLNNYQIQTIYFGGGTPSLIDISQIKLIIKEIKLNFKIIDNPEITIEINPQTANLEKLEKYKEVGINRLSFGVQTTDDALLLKMNRLGSFNNFLEVYKAARKLKFNNINIDLIFGLPGQSYKNWQQTLNKVIGLKPEHLACYSLELDNNSHWSKLFKNNQLKIPSESLNRIMYQNALSKLKEAGYLHYEISNWSLKGYYCRHNFDFWHFKPYLGIGAGSSSFINNQRFSNPENIKTYINNPVKITNIKQHSNKNNLKIQYLLMGLRLINGISKSDFKKRFNLDLNKYFKNNLEELIKNKLLIEKRDYIKITRKGLDFESYIVRKLLAD